VEGVLAWCVRGAVEWFSRGLDYPEEVISATNEYFKDEDVIQHFIDEKLDLGPNYKAPASPVYSTFKSFAELNSFFVFDSREFKKRMEQKGWESKHTKTGNMWFGFRVKSSVPEYDRTLGEKGLTTTAADSRSSHSSLVLGCPAASA
jgi:phage/plasmid-associated DNA primase